MSKVRGVYVGKRPTVLADGRPISRGDVVEVDSTGEDARVLSRLACVEEIAAPKRQRRSSGSSRSAQRQETDS